MSERKNVVTRFFSGFWKATNAARKVTVNLLFLAIVVALIAMALHSDKPDVAKTTALVVAPQGAIVEQLSGDPVQRALDELRGTAEPETLLKDVLDAIDEAKDDERVEVLVLDLSRMGRAGMSKLQDLRASILEFKESGKKVVATSDVYHQYNYYLAAHADEIFLHHMGLVIFEGFGRFKTYYKDGLDRLGVDVHVFRVGEYKSAVEPYLRDDMSEEAKEANLEWLGDLWRSYLEDVAEARGVAVADLTDYIESFKQRLDAVNGKTSQMALDAGLIDHAASRDQVRDRLIELVGEDEETHSFHRIGLQDYLKAVDGDRSGAKAKGDLVGVVIARGTILDGTHPPGKIGGDSTAALIRQARNNEDIKALVLRVDSGGGSAFASEVIRKEFELAREAGKPVVVSMGSVAASGGYVISLASDEVWASPTTITGSIGIFGMIPTFQKPMAKYLGMRVDGVGTTRLSGAVRPDRELSPEIGEIIQTIIDEGYQDFITKVADSRDMTIEEVDQIARGRVWSGEDAHEIGLVDKMGGLEDAISAAAQLADLGDDYSVRYVEKELEFKDRVMKELLATAKTVFGTEAATGFTASPLVNMMRSVAEQVERAGELNDPNGVYAYSWIETD